MSPLTPAPNGYPIKLVRDRTPQIINASNEPGYLWYEKVGDADSPTRIRLLRLKLSEEVGEFLVDGGVDELSDVLAVIEALAATFGLSLDDLTAKLRDDPRGGFLQTVVMYGRHVEYDQ